MTTEPLRVLLVEASETSARLVTEELDACGSSAPDVARASSFADALTTLQGGAKVDAVLLDLAVADLPDDVIEAIAKVASHVAVIALVSHGDDEDADAWLSRGAQDYVVKGRIEPFALGRAIRHAVLRKRAELRARHASRQELLRVVSHDLRNPLYVVSLATAALDRRLQALGGDERARQGTLKINQAVETMNRLIGDLLDLERAELGALPLQPSAVDPCEIVNRARETLTAVAQQKGVAFETTVIGELPTIHADGDRVLQAVSNLVARAFRTAPAEGSVSLTVDTNAGMVRFCVRDGVPIADASELAHVFDRARNGSENRATSLALAVARSIVVAHGGRIGADSDGDGTRLWFALPVDTAHAALRDRKPTPDAAVRQHAGAA